MQILLWLMVDMVIVILLCLLLSVRKYIYCYYYYYEIGYRNCLFVHAFAPYFDYEICFRFSCCIISYLDRWHKLRRKTRRQPSRNASNIDND